MVNNNLLERVREAGFENLEGFIEVNLKYLPEYKQRLFYSVAGISESGYSGKEK